MGICVNCAHKGTCTLVSYYEAQGEHIVKCGKRKPTTNADHIRAMTDEELAIAILKHKCESCDWVGFCKTWDECKADLVKWLKEEAEPGAKL